MMVTFDTMKDHYPMEDREALFRTVLGGGWPDLIDNPNYENTCAIRMSVAFNQSGSPITQTFGQRDGNHKDKHGNHIVIKVPTIFRFLELVLGDPSWGMSKEPNTPFEFSVIPAKRGILVYRADFSDAAGHTDLWRVNRCWYNCPEPHLDQAYEVAFWELL